MSTVPAVANSVSTTSVNSDFQKPYERVVKAIKTSHFSFFCERRKLERDIQVLTNAQLINALNEAFADWNGDVVEASERLSRLIPLDKLTEADSPEKLLNEAKTKLIEAKYALDHVEQNTSPSLKAKWHDFIDTFLSIIERILGALGIAELFKESQSEMHGSFKFDKLVGLGYLFVFLTSTLLPLLGVTAVAPIVGGVLLFIIALSLIYPHIRPRASHLPNAENWTHLYEMKKLEAPQGRKKVLDQMNDAISCGRHPLLVGKTGVGKTATAKAFVAAIARGDYPDLKGKVVHYVSAHSLLNTGTLEWGHQRLAQINEAMGRHRKDFILIIDEVHLLLNKNMSPDAKIVGAELQRFLDKGHENFPHVIGITTDKDYEAYIAKNESAFARRFKHTPVGNTENAETKKILRDFYLQKVPSLDAEKGVFNHIIEVSERLHRAQPMASTEILEECLERIRESHRSRKEKEIAEKKEEIERASAALAVGDDPEGDVAALNRQLQVLEKELMSEKEKLLALTSHEKQKLKAKKMFYQTIAKIDHLNARKYFLLSRVILPSLTKTIQKEGQALSVETSLTKALVDAVIKDECDREEKVCKTISGGESSKNEK